RRPRTDPGTTQGTRRTAQGAIRTDVAAGVRGDRSAHRAAAGPALGLSTSSPPDGAHALRGRPNSYFRLSASLCWLLVPGRCFFRPALLVSRPFQNRRTEQVPPWPARKSPSISNNP